MIPLIPPRPAVLAATLAIAAAALGAGCSEDSSKDQADTGLSDAAVDGSADAALDGGQDSAADATVDATPDTTPDSTTDTTPDPCAACDANATCDPEKVESPCTCNAGFAGDGTTCAVIGLTACRAVDSLGTTATGPTGVNPAYLPDNDEAGAPPSSGKISDSNPTASNYWDFDYLGLNTGAFNDTVQLTDAAGNNVGNPVVLMSAGHDYSGVDADPSGPCNSVDTFQVVLEGSFKGELIDLSGPSTAIGETTVTTTWSSSDPSAVSVSDAGLLTAASENACATIQWSVSPSDPAALAIDTPCVGGSFVACVDSGGVDTQTRKLWLPVGDIDANLPGMPSGPALPQAGESVAITLVVNSGVHGLAAYAAATAFSAAILQADTDTDAQSIGGSTQPAMASPFAVNASNAGQVRWNDVDAFATHAGVFDLATANFSVVTGGTATFEFTNEELADGSACNIWVKNPCMPFNSYVCPNPPPSGGYKAIAASGTIAVPPTF